MTYLTYSTIKQTLEHALDEMDMDQFEQTEQIKSALEELDTLMAPRLKATISKIQ